MATRTNELQEAVIHVRFAGRNLDVPLGMLDLGIELLTEIME